MKDARYANRGAPLESFLRFANDRYRHYGLACIDKIPTEFIPIRDRYGKVCSVKVERKSTVDFLGRWKHYPIAIEAKNSSTDTIRWDRVEQHQAEYMDAFTAQPGTIGMVVVSFGLKEFYAIPWAFWGAAYDLRVRNNDRKAPIIVQAFDVTWNIPQKASVRKSEIPREFLIPNHDLQYGIHYLQSAEKYITQPEKPQKQDIIKEDTP